MGTKVEGSYFDTWHDGASVAAKDFILYRVYNQKEEAANFATSFNSSLASTCQLDGNTDLASLHSAWANVSAAWNGLSSPAQSLIINAVADSGTSAEVSAQCKAKYLYIVSKYSSDPLLNDFMGLRPESLITSVTKEEAKERDLGSVVVLSLFGVSSGLFLIAQAKKRRKTQ